ncbi:MAG: hypothetical protein JXB30_19875 [Anaerolineae bacterium]|nr:hypothetical protein [Anaerolineae bacterium]
MFRRHSFFVRALLALIILGGFAATGMLAYRAGAAHGYVQGTADTGEEAESLSLAHPFLMSRMTRRAAVPHFPFMGPFCCSGLLFLMAMAMLFRAFHWHHPPMMWARHVRWAGHRHTWHEYGEPPNKENAETGKKADETGAR